MRISRACLSIAAIVLWASVRDVHAQGAPTIEGAIGYAFMHDQDSSLDFPYGWIASVGGYATNWLMLVGEVGGSYTTQSSDLVDVALKQHTFTTGPRLTVPAASRFAPFTQVLVGIAHGSLDVDVPGLNFVARGTNFIVSPGGGVDLNFSTRRALRFEVDARFVRDQGDTRTQLRFAGAFVFRN
jgi:hypothetical protein